MKNILCVKWGDKYSTEYVEKLKQQIEKYCSYDFNFYCLTDKPEKEYDLRLPQTWDKYFIPNRFWAYRKLYMFNEELFKWDIEGDEFLFFDLDVVFHNSIDYFFELEMSKPWIVRGWWNDLEHCKKNYNKGISPLINSSVIRWNKGQLKDIYHHIEANIEYIFFTYKTIDNYFNRVWYDIRNDKSEKFNLFEKNKIYSWYKGNIFPDDMETNVLRKDHIVCLFNNNTIEDDKAIEEVWKQNV
mgnify:FL=1